MASFLLRRRAVWAVPAVVAGVVVVAGVLPTSALGTGHPKLPPRSAAQLLAAVQTSSTTALSGTVVETARLGLPALPGSDRSATLSLQALTAGSHTARVWVDGPDRQRFALLGQLAESDVVHNGRDVWTYASNTTAVTHLVAPAGTPAATPEEPTGPARDPRALTPQAAAAQALEAIDPTTVVGVERTAVVAGRPAYTLRLAPRDTGSTVRQVLLAVDGQTSVPLRVQVYGAAAAPAFETGFTDVSFQTPPASVFRFTPPPGAKVSTKAVPTPQRGAGTHSPARPDTAGAPDTAGVKVHGTGWTTVLELPFGSLPTAGSKAGGSAAAGSDGSSPAALLDRLSRPGPDGSRTVHTALVNGLVTRDGRVFLGAVSPDLLTRAAADKAGGKAAGPTR